MTLEEWYKQAERGTSGDMVYDILRDWKNDRDQLAQEMEMLLNELEALREEAEETGNVLAAALGGTLGSE
jgi:hypothetical protein